MTVRDLFGHLERALVASVEQALRPAPPPPPPHILELRIHGISSTPPAALLEVDGDDVQNLRGDTLGSFWGLTPDAEARARQCLDTHHQHVRPEVHREAYSWGQMARSSPAAPGVGTNAWAQRLSRAGWMFLVPMGLANAAYWSRRLSRDPAVFARGAGSIRLFGLGLTLLVVIAVQVVSLDLIATQCFADDGPRCPSLPAALSSLETFTWTQRLALMSLVPVAVLGLLYWLSAGSRVRYEQPTSDAVTAAPVGDAAPHGEGVEPTRDDWSLAHPDLWSRWGLTSSMARLHFAAGMALTVMTIAAADVWGTLGPCRDLVHFVVTPECYDPGGAAARRWPSAALFAVALLLLATASFLVWRASYLVMPNHARVVDDPGTREVRTGSDGPPPTDGQPGGAVRAPSTADRRQKPRDWQKFATFVFGAAVAAFVAEAVLLWGWGRDSGADDALPELPVGPALLVGVLLATAIVGTTWRAHGKAWTGIAWLGAVLTGGALVAVAVGRAGGPDLLAVPGVPAGAVTPATVAAAGTVLLVGSAALWRSGQRSESSGDRPRAGMRGLLPRRSEPPTGRRGEGWWGTAPAVFLVLSLGIVVMLTSLLVVAVGDWLNGSLPAQCLDSDMTTQQPEACRPVATPATPADDIAADGAPQEGAADDAPVALVIPRTYTVFTMTTVFALAGAVAIGLLAAVWTGSARVYRRRRRLSEDVTEAPAGLPPDAAERHRPGDLSVVHPAGTLAALLQRPDLTNARLRTRRLAAIAKRAELVLGCIAVAYAVALAVTVWWATVEPVFFREQQAWVHPLTSVGLWGTALLWTALVIRVVSQASTERPLALMWDLMCFLPRSAHPFGPPCYAERVVPEVSGRVLRWLDSTPATSDTGSGAPDGTGRTRPDDPAQRLVVLSAHSLGAVLAIAAIFTQVPGDVRGRVGLLTYGTQVRPYFGRFFPELLGSQVMGTVPCPPPRAVTPDPWPPWERDGSGPRSPVDPAGGAGTLIERLGGTGSNPPAWVSLWRSTDPLGMPVASDAPNYVDRGAEELDTTAYVASVATHGGYPRVAAYRHAFDEVLDRMAVIRADRSSDGHVASAGSAGRAVDGRPRSGGSESRAGSGAPVPAAADAGRVV